MWRLRWRYWRGADAGELARLYYPKHNADPAALASSQQSGSGTTRSAPGKSTATGVDSDLRRLARLKPAQLISQSVSVLVFAKAPVAGHSKTRLIPALGADGAAQLATTLLDRALTTAKAARLGPVQLWCTPDTSHPALIAAAQAHGASLHQQQGEDLGERMNHALGCALLEGRRGALLIGTDCPTLTAEDLRAAAAKLQNKRDAVLIPASDGGYVLR
jgi:rSAM/selenodomain-associated transferase 1